MSTSTKLRLLDKAWESMDPCIMTQWKENPLVKVTGDNLDIYVRTSQSDIH